MSELQWSVGIDVSKKKLDIALLRDSKIKSKVLPNNAAGFKQLSRWLDKQSVSTENTRCCLEATGPYSEQIATWLDDAGFHVSVVNPVRVKGYGQSEFVRDKTDRADAALIARFCANVKPEPWHAPAPEIRALRAMVDRLDELKENEQQERNRQQAYESQAQQTMAQHVGEHITWLGEQISQLQRQIDDHIDRHPDLKQDADLMKSIPGIGSTSTASIMAYAGDLRRFKDAKALAAYVGVTPRTRESGSSIRGRTAISRMGHTKLRRAMYMPGLVARHHNEALKLFADQLQERGLAKKPVIIAVMRKLTHIIYGVIKSGKPFDAKLALPRLEFKDGI